ncbi:hypothetical protein SSX86_022965 [Deinandra increscens subsp. villosa]|uniref:Replication factor A C-terminal domain-containing protein n=1 Tax=Deinandra increscens subsp. villosa TaxID=3103831 RepID=A0AAP0GSZ9_9ASTR
MAPGASRGGVRRRARAGNSSTADGPSAPHPRPSVQGMRGHRVVEVVGGVGVCRTPLYSRGTGAFVASTSHADSHATSSAHSVPCVSNAAVCHPYTSSSARPPILRSTAPVSPSSPPAFVLTGYVPPATQPRASLQASDNRAAIGGVGQSSVPRRPSRRRVADTLVASTSGAHSDTACAAQPASSQPAPYALSAARPPPFRLAPPLRPGNPPAFVLTGYAAPGMQAAVSLQGAANRPVVGGVTRPPVRGRSSRKRPVGTLVASTSSGNSYGAGGEPVAGRALEPRARAERTRKRKPDALAASASSSHAYASTSAQPAPLQSPCSATADSPAPFVLTGYVAPKRRRGRPRSGSASSSHAYASTSAQPAPLHSPFSATAGSPAPFVLAGYIAPKRRRGRPRGDSNTIMAHEPRISSIQVAKASVPIQVRVIRKWKPFANGTKWSYLLVDKYGDAVQAMIEQIEDMRAPNRIKLMACYTVDHYNCIPPPGLYKVALHHAAIRIDSTTPFVPLHDDGGIPTAYYNFTSYETMVLRANLNKVLTDLIGMVYSIEFGDPERKTPRIKLNMEEPSGQKLQVALWPEIAEALDVDMLLDSNYKLIIAFTSVRVTKYFDILQFESTSATRIEVEPELEITRSLRVAYHERNPVEDLTDVVAQKIQVEAAPAEKNRVSIAQILEYDLQAHRGMAYTCAAEITTFTEGKSWRYGTCPICNATMDPQEGAYVCTKHREQEPNYKYCVKCDISDGSGTVSVTIFDQPMAQLLGVSCNDMVRVHGNPHPLTMPEAIAALKNQTKVYQLNNVTKDAGGNLRFAVNRIYRPEVGEKRVLGQSPSSSKATGKKPMLLHTETPPQVVVATKQPMVLHTPDIMPKKPTAVTEDTPPGTGMSAASSTVTPGQVEDQATTRPRAMKKLFADKDAAGHSDSGDVEAAGETQE